MKLIAKTLALVTVGALAACSNGKQDAVEPLAFKGQDVHANWGPITTHPIIGQYQVPAGTTPTGGTGYAVANTARSNGTIVNGTAAFCDQANGVANYSEGCRVAAGGGQSSNPYQ